MTWPPDNHDWWWHLSYLMLMNTNRASRLLLLHLLPLLHQVGVGHHLHLVRHVLDRLLVVTLKHSIDWSLHNNCRYVKYNIHLIANIKQEEKTPLLGCCTAWSRGWVCHRWWSCRAASGCPSTRCPPLPERSLMSSVIHYHTLSSIMIHIHLLTSINTSPLPEMSVCHPNIIVHCHILSSVNSCHIYIYCVVRTSM